MPGVVELESLLQSLSPELQAGQFVFCSVDEPAAALQRIEAVATFREKEGVTLVVSKQNADRHRLTYDAVFRQITLNVQSSLDAVGLTAAVATKLASRGISANVVAAFHHDHIFVPDSLAEDALSALQELSKDARS